MTTRRVGLWLIGAFGGVGSTVALGLAALARGLTDHTGLVTELPAFDGLDLDPPASFVVGGHDIRQGSFFRGACELHDRAGVFDAAVLNACKPDLEAWSANVRPGSVRESGPTIAALADLPESLKPETPRAAIARFQNDLRLFRESNQLDQVVTVNVASTEPPFEFSDTHYSLDRLNAALDRQTEHVLPASSLYAYAALDLGMPYVNFTPSPGATVPALQEMAVIRQTICCGQDGKTGETLMKSVLAPMFAKRHLQILSWVGHNIFGNRDGVVLNDPSNKASKVRTKDALIQQIVGYHPQTHVSIEYIESMDDWKTAWDHIHYRGFLGTKMILQFIWQGCDSLLAAPLVIDLARLALLAQRRGEAGVFRAAASFFKSPIGVTSHDFFEQWSMLEEWIRNSR